jgi:Fur family zinc uptake transcriptional regulator
MEALTEMSAKHIAPPTIYRALEFWLDQGFIHRINSLNAFVGCSSYPHGHQSFFLICQSCGVVTELQLPKVDRHIQSIAKKERFVVSSQSLEIVGSCGLCTADIKRPFPASNI